MITTSEIREKFLTYFEKQGHRIVSSGPLVPGNDKTLLFTNAGMVQFKDLFTGVEKRDYRRATTSQRCVRAGGKHNDLDNVGYTARHHTFFEMLGNFSFGDYFKQDAIRFAWEFLTGELGLAKDRLWVTVFEEDDEAYDLWVDDIGVPPERVARIGAKDNFWMMGDTGPCGPCSEIFYDHGPEVEGGPPGTPEEDGDRYIEIWNLVFMQFERAGDGSMTPLPMPSVDTGMGLERIAAVLQHVHSNYEIDLFRNLLAAVLDVTDSKDTDSASLRVIADHIRSCAFLITDGVLPSNEGRGYVLRRIIRRAARHGLKLGVSEPFFHRLVKPLIDEMGEAYPELVEARSRVEDELRKEEERFSATLTAGMKILDEAIGQLDDSVIPGDVVFKLYDTYGFPVDLTADIARERQLQLDEAGFEAAMEEQRNRARAASNFGGTGQLALETDIASRFDGYENSDSDAKVIAVYHDDKPASTLASGQSGVCVLDTTPFYGESGGQVGDTGTLAAGSGSFVVTDTQKQGGAILHYGTVEDGTLSVGDRVTARIDSQRRQAIVRNHSATHLMHAGLRKVLGTHVEQKGSLVNEHHLRFDFSHGSPVSQAELQAVERWVNDQIRSNGSALVREMSMEDAINAGAMALFGEKYGDIVRVVSIGEQSTELCGGTHVRAAGDIGAFRIQLETGVAAGVRRIEALSGEAALVFTAGEHELLTDVMALVKGTPDTVKSRIEQLQSRNRELSRELEKLQARLSSLASGDLAGNAVEVNGVSVLAHKLEGSDAKALRTLLDQLKQKLGKAAIVLATEKNGKAILIAGVTSPLNQTLNAGELVNVVAGPLGGKGGGRADMAQAGADSFEGIDAALAGVEPWVARQMGA